MENNEILIIQCQVSMNPQKLDALREQILKQKETGVILLPYYCTAVTKPKDIDILEEHKDQDVTFDKDHGGDGYQYVMR